MAYDQNAYQPPQRPYNGRAAQRPGPQDYNQAPQQQYPPQQYAQDGYGYDDYNNQGYAQEYDQGYQGQNEGRRGNGYPPQNQGYPPQQEYYGNDRGGMAPRGGGRGPPMGRPPPGNMRGGYGGDQGRGYPNGVQMGRGGRPGPPGRVATSDPGPKRMARRKPLKTPPISPNVLPNDNPFPTFPGSQKKTSISEEQKIIQQMALMEVGTPAPKGRPRGPGSKGSRTDGYGRPSMDSQRRAAPPDDYGRPSMEGRRPGPDARGRPSGESQRSMTRGYPPQQQGGPPGRAPSAQGYQQPPQNGYAEPGYDNQDNFGSPGRSMTFQNGPGPGGRGGPPRPSTAGGQRLPPQRQYPPQGSPHQDGYGRGRGQPPPIDPYAAPPGPVPQNYSSHSQSESINEFYDAYYDSPGQQHAQPNMRRPSTDSEMPNFDAVPNNPGNHRRGTSIDEHIQAPQPNGFAPQLKPAKSQPDFRNRAQPQAAVFDMAPPLPNAHPQQGYDDGYGGGQGGYDQFGQGPPGGYGQYNEAPIPQQNGFVPPPRSASAAPPGAGRGGFGGGLPGGPRPGLPQGPGPVRANTMQNGPPPPVRAGLIPNSVASLAANKPTPVRNYNGMAPQPSPGQGPSPQATPAAAGPPAPPSVTVAELEQLRAKTKANPADQATGIIYAKKLVEASEVLVQTIPDQRARDKARAKYVMDAHKMLKKLVAAQNTEAMFILADSYGKGALGLETDNKEAFTLYQSAAKSGHAAAAYRTAVCCELGNDEGGGTRKDPLKAIQWYKRAATLGDTPAMYKMGMIQLKGLLGQPKNPREAVGWLKRAAERADAENPHALHELGLLFEAEQSPESSVMRDEMYSIQLFNQAAELGYKFSQFRLGCAYEYGLFGCQIDPRKSIMWYSRAAAQEEHQSELALSGWYLTGFDGVLQQSDTEAYLWARKAAMAGLAKAEYAMGYFTEVGIGSPANLEDAKRWYWRAAAQNFPKARERLEDLKRGGKNATAKSRERISRSQKQEGDCVVM
ncbi:hypothetical protein HYALB_00012227 [Hymenoscyphus albidus]|uniref:Uncharacterized protein n=1 Tax=Hymenoscyphus albidus TaxID=595503 RepID=A0A9N9LV00_9HELO|nr:hypothetical protein HYALB_00012227 [Hymenoscyphus albidus]